VTRAGQDQNRQKLDVVLVQVEVVNPIKGWVVVAVVVGVRRQPPLRRRRGARNDFLLHSLAVLASNLPILAFEPVKLSNCEVRPESKTWRGLMPTMETGRTWMASRWVWQGRSSLVLLAVDVACMARSGEEADLGTVKGFRVGRLIDWGGGGVRAEGGRRLLRRKVSVASSTTTTTLHTAGRWWGREI